MRHRVSARMKARRLARLLSAQRMKFVALVTTARHEAALQMIEVIREDLLVQRNTFGTVMRNLTPSPTPRGWVFLSKGALLLLLILLAWTALVQSSKQESSRWLLCGPTPSLQVGGLSTSEGLKPSFKSAELDISKLNPRSKKHETVQGQFP